MTIPHPPRYEVRPGGAGFIIWDSFRQEIIDPLDRDRPVMPLSEVRVFGHRPSALRVAKQLNDAYARIG